MGREEKEVGTCSIEEHVRLLKEGHDDVDILRGNALQMPEWFDPDKFRRGQQYFKENYFALFVSKLAGLLLVLTVPKILDMLILTRQSSSPKTAFKRYFSTISHMLLWYNGDVTDTNSRAFQSLQQVHSKHLAAHNRGSAKQLTVSQASLALTQFGFMGLGLLVPHKLGIQGTEDKDVMAWLHFWRTIGYLVGIDDKFNICRESLAESKELCSRILSEIYQPQLESAPKSFDDMAMYLLHGMWAMVPSLDNEAFMCYTKYLCGLEPGRASNWYSRFIFAMQIFVHETLLSSKWFGAFWRGYWNFQLWLGFVITSQYPFLAYYAFGKPL